MDNSVLPAGARMTYSIGSDRYPVTVVEATARKVVTRDDNILGPDTFEPNPQGRVREFTLRDDGSWRSKGSRSGFLSPGSSYYLDPHF